MQVSFGRIRVHFETRLLTAWTFDTIVFIRFIRFSLFVFFFPLSFSISLGENLNAHKFRLRKVRRKKCDIQNERNYYIINFLSLFLSSLSLLFFLSSMRIITMMRLAEMCRRWRHRPPVVCIARTRSYLLSANVALFRLFFFLSRSFHNSRRNFRERLLVTFRYLFIRWRFAKKTFGINYTLHQICSLKKMIYNRNKVQIYICDKMQRQKKIEHYYSILLYLARVIYLFFPPIIIQYFHIFIVTWKLWLKLIQHSVNLQDSFPRASLNYNTNLH